MCAILGRKENVGSLGRNRVEGTLGGSRKKQRDHIRVLDTNRQAKQERARESCETVHRTLNKGFRIVETINGRRTDAPLQDQPAIRAKKKF
jgi:hypothetical protein